MAKLNDKLMNRVIQGKLVIEEGDDTTLILKTKDVRIAAIQNLKLEDVSDVNIINVIDEDSEVTYIYSYYLVEKAFDYRVYGRIFCADDGLQGAMLETVFVGETESSIYTQHFDEIGISYLKGDATHDAGKSLVVNSDGTITTKLQPTLYTTSSSFLNLGSDFVAQLKVGDVIYSTFAGYLGVVRMTDGSDLLIQVMTNTQIKLYYYYYDDGDWLFDSEETYDIGTKLYKHNLTISNQDPTDLSITLISTNSTNLGLNHLDANAIVSIPFANDNAEGVHLAIVYIEIGTNNFSILGIGSDANSYQYSGSLEMTQITDTVIPI